MKNWRYVVYIMVVALSVSLPFYAGAYLQHVAATILIYLALTISWDMMFRSGLPSLGIAGFFGLGAYAAALSFLYWEINPLLCIFFGGFLAFAIALVLGLVILRVRGLYFAIVTLALSSIFMVIAMNWPSLTGGPVGKVLPSAIFGGDAAKIYWLVLAIAIFIVMLSEVFQRTRIYFALTSIRNNEILAKSSGIDIFKYLVFAFAITSALQGMVGGAYAHIYGFISPEGSFHMNFILLPVTMALLGGTFSTLGPIVGAVTLGAVGEYLKLLIPYGHLLVYGVVIVVVIVFMPKGIVGTVKERLRGLRVSPT